MHWCSAREEEQHLKEEEREGEKEGMRNIFSSFDLRIRLIFGSLTHQMLFQLLSMKDSGRMAKKKSQLTKCTGNNNRH